MSTLCSGKLLDKLRYLFSQLTNVNGHMMPERFAAFLRDVARISSAVGEERQPQEVSQMKISGSIITFTYHLSGKPKHFPRVRRQSHHGQRLHRNPHVGPRARLSVLAAFAAPHSQRGDGDALRPPMFFVPSREFPRSQIQVRPKSQLPALPSLLLARPHLR